MSNIEKATHSTPKTQIAENSRQQVSDNIGHKKGLGRASKLAVGALMGGLVMAASPDAGAVRKVGETYETCVARFKQFGMPPVCGTPDGALAPTTTPTATPNPPSTNEVSDKTYCASEKKMIPKKEWKKDRCTIKTQKGEGGAGGESGNTGDEVEVVDTKAYSPYLNVHERWLWILSLFGAGGGSFLFGRKKGKGDPEDKIKLAKTEAELAKREAEMQKLLSANTGLARLRQDDTEKD